MKRNEDPSSTEDEDERALELCDDVENAIGEDDCGDEGSAAEQGENGEGLLLGLLPRLLLLLFLLLALFLRPPAILVFMCLSNSRR